jgi:hypothetical protein
LENSHIANRDLWKAIEAAKSRWHTATTRLDGLSIAAAETGKFLTDTVNSRLIVSVTPRRLPRR